MPDPTPDQVTAFLAGAQEAVRQQDELVARMRTAAVSAVEFNAAQDRLAERVPSLLAAVAEVFKAHRPVIGEDGRDRCAWCRTSPLGQREPWPCGEFQNVSSALLGEGKAGG